jgi:hypothetical protein
MNHHSFCDRCPGPERPTPFFAWQSRRCLALGSVCCVCPDYRADITGAKACLNQNSLKYQSRPHCSDTCPFFGKGVKVSEITTELRKRESA